MSFDKAIKYLTDYRDSKAKELNNEKRHKWSTVKFTKLNDIDTIFDSKDENDQWEKYNTDTKCPTYLLQGQNMKIAFLAGCRRDVRITYISGENNPRTAMDHYRFGFIKALFYKLKLDRFSQIIYNILNKAKK